MMHYIVVREDLPGQFTAYPCGLPELTVTAVGRAEAIKAVTEKLNDWFVSGRLVPIRLPGYARPPESPWESEARAEMQRAFEETMERNRQEDLEQTIAEYEAECPSTSSTRTT